ncbi:Magnesium-transporting ATPase, P-type 1 [Cedecea neteri]|uniref:Magnesium-transporting ATPase, P-type 1 n=1 Tax=Cedecea neteri TaxID=158822 RepID=A0A2X3IE54_9ENTR|nr:Magnesium-transporting ATPase, P-type 1 [Cedecea neteri]
MGTNVVSGTAQAVVVATGPRTYFGSLAKAIVGSRAQTAFDRGVNSVSWLLIRFMLVMVPVVFLINGLMKGEWWDALLFCPCGCRGPDARNAADDRQRQPCQRRGGDGEA